MIPLNKSHAEPPWRVMHLVARRSTGAIIHMVVAGGRSSYTTEGSGNVEVYFLFTDVPEQPFRVSMANFPWPYEVPGEDYNQILYPDVPFEIAEHYWLENGL